MKSRSPKAEPKKSKRLPKAETPFAVEHPPRSLLKDFDEAEVVEFLRRRDPKLGRLMKRIGPFQLKVDRKGSPYEWLLRSIIFQQLSGKAAGTIHGRVKELFGGRNPTPEEVLTTPETSLRSAGLSRQKIAAVKDLAKAAAEGRVPDRKKISKLSDEEIIELLIPIRGVGRWTVEMLLIFGLGRADVLAVDDFAIKKSAMILHSLKEMPDRKTLSVLGERWKPYRTVASWYLWRSLD
jgi:3-methyladenine DNA glycosylase/8-oxoguanine DNA glycosylase